MDSSLTCAHLRGLSKSYLTSFVSDKLASFAKNIPQCETCKIPMQGVWMCLETNCGYSACERDFSSHAKMRQTENAVHGLSISSDTGVIRCQTCAQDICINSLDAPEDIYPIIETLYLLRRKVWKKFDPRSVAKIDSLILPTTRPRGVCGLKNIGNTCFMNASLQALFACQYFSQYFRKGFTSDGIAKKVVLSEAFLSVINDIWAHEKTVVTPSSIFRQVVEINPYFDGYQQQDAQEFIRCVLDRLNDEIGEVHLSKSSTVSNDLKSLGEKEDAPSSSTPPLAHTPTVSMISDLFEGEFQTHLSCRGCGQKSIRKEHFHDISIGIAAASSRSSTTSPGGEKKPKGIISSLLSSFKGKHRSPSLFSSGVSLADCFAEFVKEEYLTEDKLTCDHCKKPNEFIKQTFISKLPQVVCVHLKRFQYKGNSGFKVATLVQFSQELNTTTCLPPQLTPEERESLERKYDLKAIICHRGGYNGGHYIAFAKTKHGQWFRYDDDRVERSSLSEVLKQEAYMLFYENARPQQEVLHIRSLIRTNVTEKPYYISNAWYARWKYYPNPGPIINGDFVCVHGKSLRPGVPISKYRKIPESAWRAFQRLYGGGPEVTKIGECLECKTIKAEVDKQRAEEKSIIEGLDTTRLEPGEKWFIINSDWIVRWQMYNNQNYDYPPPGPVTNHELLTSDGRPRLHLEKVKHYRAINRRVWDYFMKRYGGGPAIERRVLDIYSEP